jgi:hypothetical protein
MIELEANVYACEFLTVDGVGGGSGGHKDFDVSIRGMVSSCHSKREGAFVLELSV